MWRNFAWKLGAVNPIVNQVWDEVTSAWRYRWLALSIAFALAILGWLHLLNGDLILLFVFLIGAGFALNAPAFAC